ncbi:MAG: type II toxin-antitoxin system VapC family toxin [Solirubrobacteraceae bacterium]
MTVIDASVWLDLVVGRLPPDVLPQPPVLVPCHFDAEVLSGLRGLSRGGHLAPQDAQRRVAGLARAPLLRVPVRELLGDAWPLSGALSAYDAPYVALARREAVGLLTADRKLARGAAGLCDVRLLA